MRLKDRVAIVTGGARGIGKAISELFAKEGAQVVIWDLLDAGEETAEGIRMQGGQAVFKKVSVADFEQVTAEAQAVFERYGSIDILINNAGITRDKSFLKSTPEEWQLVMDVNLSSVYYCSKAVVPFMQQNNYGRIVSASSSTGLRGNFGQTNYAASKAGIIGMTKTMAIELGKFGITVNAIAPGFTVTEMTAQIPEEVTKGMLEHIPVRKVAQPIDIAYGYLYLASDEASFVSGICLPIDGGVTR
ncbi:MAG: 3-oxoacyl-ACP reductase FabG [Microscillaceae bacterium]|nr:3-oxoacyl-ACP reductase FabG [Microscillaceae bacterium]